MQTIGWSQWPVQIVLIIVWQVMSLSTTSREMVGRIRGLVLRSSLVWKMKSTPAAVLPDVVPDDVCSE